MPVGAQAFAVQLQLHDDSMTPPLCKIRFQPNDILIIDPSKKFKSGDFVLAFTPTVVLRKYVNENGGGAYLAALNSKHVSIPYGKENTIIGVVVERITLFP